LARVVSILAVVVHQADEPYLLQLWTIVPWGSTKASIRIVAQLAILRRTINHDLIQRKISLDLLPSTYATGNCGDFAVALWLDIVYWNDFWNDCFRHVENSDVN
jgi:hypothetical protein